MADVLIDTNVFQKLFGFYKNHNNNDKSVDVEKMYNDLLFDDDNNLFIPVHCVYELFNKPFYKNKTKEILVFLLEYKIKILEIESGKVKIFKYGHKDIEEYNSDLSVRASLINKIRFEINEIKEFSNYLVFVTKYVIVDYLRTILSQHGKFDTNLDEIVLNLFKDNQDHIDKIVNHYVTLELINGYKNDTAQKRIKEFLSNLCGKLFSEIYSLLNQENPEISDILSTEQELILKISNKFEYLKNKIRIIEKNNNIDYLEIINKKYASELIDLKYPIDFVDYLIFTWDKSIRNARYNKNDAIDSSLFFYSHDKLILSFDGSICHFLKDVHPENFNFVQMYAKK